MEREKFIDALYAASQEIPPQYEIDAVQEKVLDPKPLDIGRPGTRNLVIVMEELAELQKELSKALRGKANKVGLIEEVADVYLSLRYVEIICGLSERDIHRAMNVKLDRLKETTGVYT